MEKTNATRLLDAASVSYEIRTYEYSEDDLSGVHAAAVLGMDPDRVFKTLVAKGDRTGICVFCIPVAAELDLKRAAAVSGNKKIEMAHVKDLLALTGYIRGGCSPVGMKKKYPTYIDETAQLYDTIAVSAGKRGMQMLLSPEDLRAYCEAEFADIAQ
ncbi:MAG: Cys-tRNA(Pro) deacylase [Oscillospiraceae bacterium]|nr:Cys-tRNA(Pro) deacylase [Oscillospiraceae bacterium]MBQ3878813.1 Cys-tRNA(Pro) deacylase [Oscillospiraceae bacterium]